MQKYGEKFADGLDIAYCIKANVWRPAPKLCKYVGSSTSEQLKSMGPSLYYVSIFLAFWDPIHPPFHPLYKRKYSTEKRAFF